MAEIVSLPDGIAAVVKDGDTLVMEGFTHLIPFAAGGFAKDTVRSGDTEVVWRGKQQGPAWPEHARPTRGA